MPQVLTIGALIIIICILSNKISSRFGIPMLLVFIVLGMFFGSEGIFKIPFDDFAFAEEICTVALIYIMFYGGFGTRWKVARTVAVKAALMSSLGTVITAVVTGAFCYRVLNFDLLEGMLIGAVLGSTDAASVFSVLRSQKLALKNNTDSLLEVESGSNDPFAYMLTLILLSAMKAGTSVSVKNMFFVAGEQILIGAFVGVVIALGARAFFERFNFEVSGFETIFIFAVALMAYALPSSIGGNGYLSTYLVGIILGNSQIDNKKGLVNFFDGLTGLMQMMIFFMLGLLSYPSKIAAVCIPGMIIALVLTFAARPLAVAALLTPMKVSWRQQMLISWAGLRGAASIVFAIMVIVSGVSPQNDLFHIVFCVVLFSMLIQGSLLPRVAKKLDMINESGNILMTFNDYAEDIDVHYISLPIREGHPWISKKVKELNLPPETLLVFLKRTEENIVPTGNTIILEGDVLVLSASAYTGEDDINLKEILIDENHEWCCKQVFELKVPKNSLIIMIQRSGRTIIPDGRTRLRAGDLVVMNTVH